MNLRKCKMVMSTAWSIGLISLMLLMNFSTAMEYETFQATIQAQATLQTTNENRIGRVAILPEKNTLVDINAFGTAPGKFQVRNYDGTGSTPVERKDGEIYPLFITQRTNQVNRVQPLQNVRWVFVENNTEGKFGTYNITLSTNVIGSIKPGASMEIRPNEHQTEVKLIIDKPGVYSFIYDTGTTLSNIRDPDGNLVTAETASTTVNNLMTRSTFIANIKGEYIAYLTTAQKFVTIKLQAEPVTGFSLGSIVKYDDPEMKLSDLPIDAKVVMTIYQIGVTAGQSIRTYFKSISGTQTANIYIPMNFAYGYVSYPLQTNGLEQIHLCPLAGTVYLIITRVDPYDTGSGINYNSYRIAIFNQVIENFDVDTNKTIEVPPTGDSSIRVFKTQINGTGMLLFNHTVIQNAPTIPYVSTPDSFLMYIKDGMIYSQKATYNPTTAFRTHIGYTVVPGTYYFTIYSASTQVGIVDMKLQGLSYTDATMTALDAQGAFQAANYESYLLQNIRNDTGVYGSTFPKILKFDLPVSFKQAYSLIINASDNPQIFNETAAPARIFRFNASNSQYTEITSFPAQMFIADGNMNNDRILFAFPTKVKGLDLTLSTFANSSSFTWVYYNSGSWNTISTGLVDGTNAGAGPLTQSGSVRWNPAGWTWNPAASGSNIPTVDKSYYWVGVSCSAANTQVPTIADSGNRVQGMYFRSIAGDYNVRYFYTSPYDNVSRIIYSDRTNQAFTFSDTSTFVYNGEISPAILSPRTGYVAVYLTQLRDTANGNAQLLKDVNVKFAFGHRNNQYSFQEYDMATNVATNPANMSIFDGYNKVTQVNGTLIDAIVYKVNGSKQFDWIQFNSQLINASGVAYNIQFYWDLPWTDNSIPGSSSFTYNTADRNVTVEFGTYMTEFYVVVTTNVLNPAYFVINNIWIGGYNITVISFDAQVPLEGFNWWLVLYIGGPAVAVAVVGGYIYKKKKRPW
jgi:hypothetical protein